MWSNPVLERDGHVTVKLARRMSRSALWATYATINLAGAALCAAIMVAVARFRARNSSDVLIAGLCLGCFGMSLPCALQCLLNALHAEWYGGQAACTLEALLHVSSIMLQFFCVALIGIRSYCAVVFRLHMRVSAAVIIVCLAVLVAWLGTFAVGLASDIYLMPAGAYCFYAFTSPVITLWFIPVMLLALVVIIVCYVSIFRTVKRVSVVEGLASPTASMPDSPEGSSTPRPILAFRARKEEPPAMRAAKRSAWFVVVFLGGWGPAVVLLVYVMCTGVASPGLDTLLGIMGSLHSVAVPLFYGFRNQRLRFHLGLWRQPTAYPAMPLRLPPAPPVSQALPQPPSASLVTQQHGGALVVVVTPPSNLRVEADDDIIMCVPGIAN